MKKPLHQTHNSIVFPLLVLSIYIEFFANTLFMGRRRKVRYMNRRMLQYIRSHRR